MLISKYEKYFYEITEAILMSKQLAVTNVLIALECRVEYLNF